MRSLPVVPALAALASGLLFLSIGLGVAGMPLVAYFVQLPLLFVGFGFGLVPASIASLGSAGLVLVVGGWTAGLAFLLVEVGPVLLTIRQALLNRNNENGEPEWYPPGLILTWLVLYSLVVSGLMLGLIWWTGPGIEATFTRGIDALGEHLGSPAGAAPVMALIRDYASYIPGIVAASGILMVIINSILAQLLAQKSHRALRPSPPFGELWLPGWCMPALAVALVSAFIAGGDFVYVADTALMILAIPFLFLGLAVVHKLVGRLGARLLILGVLYTSLLIFSWPLVLVLVALGLLEERLQFRRRFA